MGNTHAGLLPPRRLLYVTLQHKTSRMGQILESEIHLVLCDSVLQELSTNIFVLFGVFLVIC
jgi:hypothetical protein